jgi:hypothetical protein
MQQPVARFGSRQRLFGALALGDVLKRSDQAPDPPVPIPLGLATGQADPYRTIPAMARSSSA